MTDSVTATSFSTSWTPAPGRVRHYRLVWKSLISGETREKTVPGDQTRTPLEGLTSETLYQVAVSAVYPHGESRPLLGEEYTEGEECSALSDTLLTMRFSGSPAIMLMFSGFSGFCRILRLCCLMLNVFSRRAETEEVLC